MITASTMLTLATAASTKKAATPASSDAAPSTRGDPDGGQAASSRTAQFDFRNMSSAKLQSSMSDIVAAAHLTIDEQIQLGVGFMRNDLTKVDPHSPDTSSQPQDILEGLNGFIAGDLSRGDIQGATSLTKLLTDLGNVQSSER